MQFDSDFLDEACKRIYGHTDWEYIDTPNEVKGMAVLFHEEPQEDSNIDEEEVDEG